jgi:hypothetical protein
MTKDGYAPIRIQSAYFGCSEGHRIFAWNLKERFEILTSVTMKSTREYFQGCDAVQSGSTLLIFLGNMSKLPDSTASHHINIGLQYTSVLPCNVSLMFVKEKNYFAGLKAETVEKNISFLPQCQDSL